MYFIENFLPFPQSAPGVGLCERILIIRRPGQPLSPPAPGKHARSLFIVSYSNTEGANWVTSDLGIRDH